MNDKGSIVRITSQEFAEFVQETSVGQEQHSESSRRIYSSFWDKLFRGRSEFFSLRPGLKLIVSDFYLLEDTEISAEFPQTGLTCVLTIEGFWNRILTDHRGRTAELAVNPGLNAAGIGPPQKYRVRMKGDQRHRNVRVDVTDPLLSELATGTERGMAVLSQPLLTSPRSRHKLMHRELSPVLECAAYQVLNCPLRAWARRLFMEGKILEILAYELAEITDSEGTNQASPNSEDLERLQKARNILEAELANPPNLFELARRVGLNDFKLKRGFKEAFGTTVFGHVRRLRMEKARSLLEMGQLNVTEAALEVGYSSFGHFSAAFKDRFGILPSQILTGKRTSSMHRK